MFDKTIDLNEVDSIDVFKNNNSKRTRITLLVFQNCNYNCSYCFRGNDKNKKPIDFEKLEKIFTNLGPFLDYHNKIFPNINEYDIKIIGGEPTLVDLSKLFKKLIGSPYKKFFRICTNFHKSVTYFENCYNTIIKDDSSLLINASIHSEYVKNDMVAFFEKAKILKAFKNIDVNFSYVLNESTIKFAKEVDLLSKQYEQNVLYQLDIKNPNLIGGGEILDFYTHQNQINKENCKITFLDGKELFGNNKDLKRFITSKNFSNFKCSATTGENNIMINCETGELHICSNNTESFGNVLENKYLFSKDFKFCKSKRCSISCNRMFISRK